MNDFLPKNAYSGSRSEACTCAVARRGQAAVSAEDRVGSRAVEGTTSLSRRSDTCLGAVLLPLWTYRGKK